MFCLMKIMFFTIRGMLLLAAVLATPYAQAKSSAKWTSIRIIIYENRSIGKQNGCSEQHVREHLYARTIHRALDKKGSWPFIVNARSSIDRIIVSVDLLAQPSYRSSITSTLKQGLTDIPSKALIASEIDLVAMENSATLARPQEADRLLWQLIPSLAPQTLANCVSIFDPETDHPGNQWRVGRYQIAFFDSLKSALAEPQLPEIVYDSNTDLTAVDTQGIYKLSIAAGAENGSTAASTDNALFLSLAGRQGAQDHIIAAKQIFITAQEMGIPSKDIRPFGIGGFILFGKPDVLSSFGKRLADARPEAANDQALQIAAYRWARDYVCKIPRGFHMTVGALADSIAFHPYYPFWMDEPICKNENLDTRFSAQAKTNESVALNSQFLSSQPRTGDSYTAPYVSYRFCYGKRDEDLRENAISRAIFFAALRQYLRMDLGTVLDIRETDVEGVCSTLRMIAPSEYHDKIIKEMNAFSPASETFSKRLHAAQIADHCSLDPFNPCQPDAYLQYERKGGSIIKNLVLKQI